jgi:hypothetical protein
LLADPREHAEGGRIGHQGFINHNRRWAAAAISGRESVILTMEMRLYGRVKTSSALAPHSPDAESAREIRYFRDPLTSPLP